MEMGGGSHKIKQKHNEDGRPCRYLSVGPQGKRPTRAKRSAPHSRHLGAFAWPWQTNPSVGL